MTTPVMCSFCPEPITGRRVGEKGDLQTGYGHPQCLALLREHLRERQDALADAQDAALLAMLHGPLHPDDARILDSLTWTRLPAEPCWRCVAQEPTTPVSAVDGNSGGGREVRYCRGCAASLMTTARVRSASAGREHVARAPSLG